MIKADEDALVCDLAETYNIFNYKELPLKLVATLSAGLRDNSRIKMAMSKSKISVEQTFLAAILDCLKVLVWLNSSDGAKGENRPTPILQKLLGVDEDKEILTFNSAEDFERERQKLILNIKERM